jgi:hypothetical protein
LASFGREEMAGMDIIGPRRIYALLEVANISNSFVVENVNSVPYQSVRCNLPLLGKADLSNTDLYLWSTYASSHTAYARWIIGEHTVRGCSCFVRSKLVVFILLASFS